MGWRSVRPILEHLEDLTLLSSVLGTLWNDTNGDGLRQLGEPGLPGQTVYADLNQNGVLDGTVKTTVAQSTAITTAPGPLGAFGFLASTMEVSGLPSRLLDLNVNLDLTNRGSEPVVVAVVSPTGLQVPNLPTLFEIQPGEHFQGTFDQQSASLVTLASRPLAQGTYRPQQLFTDPMAHIYDGDPNGTWALAFLGDVSGLSLDGWSLTFTSPEPSATTDASGGYALEGLDAGTVAVAPVHSGADQVTSPAGPGGSRAVVLAAGQDTSGVDFGIRPAPDLKGVVFDVTAAAAAWGQPVTVNYTIANQGAGNASAFDVELRLSATGVIDGSGPVLGVLHVDGLAAGASTSGSMTVLLPSAPPPGFGATSDTYFGFRVDAAGAVAESNEANNSNQGSGIDLAVVSAPANRAVASGDAVQQMPSIAVDPNDSSHLVVAYMDYALVESGYAGIGVAVSHDGGATWVHTAIGLPPGVAEGAASPTVRFDGAGHVFVSFMAATFLGPQKPALTNPASPERQFGFQSNNGIFVARSNDGGLGWTAPVAVVSHTYAGENVPFEVMPDFAVDTAATLPNGQRNPRYGDLYVTWVRLYPSGQFPGQPDSTGGSDVMFAASTDGGATWTTKLQTDAESGLAQSAIKDPDFGTNATSAPGRGFMFFPHVALGPEGDIYVSMFGAGDFTVYHSTDGGGSFRAPVRTKPLGVPFSAVVPTPTLFFDNFRTTSVRGIVADPTHPGRVYVTESNALFSFALGGTIDAGQVLFARSDDYGQTWNSMFQVGDLPTNFGDLPPGENDAFQSVLNDDDGGRYLGFADIPQLNNEVISGQALPSLSIDAQGNLTVIWYDTRRDPLGARLDVFGTVSTDGGRTFSRNFRITDTTFDPNAGAFTDARDATNFYLGDRIGVAVANGSAYAVWTDVRGGNQDVYLGRYRVAPQPAQPPVDRLDPNSTPETATDLGAVASQLVLPRLELGPDGNDWYRVQTAANGDLIVSARSDGQGGSPHIELVDLAGNVLPATVTEIVDETGAVVGQQLVYASTSGQTFLVHVHGSGTSGLGYSLVVAALTGNFGTSVQGATTGELVGADQSIYRLKTGVSGSLVVKLRPGEDASGGMALLVLGPDGQTVLAQGTTAGEDSDGSQQVTIPVTRGQDLLLVVTTGGDPSILGSFDLEFQNLDQYQSDSARSLFFASEGGPASLAVADLNRDRRPDLIVSSTDFSDPLNVMTGNGDGTFWSSRQVAVGPGLSGTLTAGFREIAVADFNGDGIPDVAVPNFRSADISVLLGNGDGSFQPQRRFDALPSPDSLITGDFNRDGKADLVVVQNFPQLGGISQFAYIQGRGDGTFLPPARYSTVFGQGAFPVRAGDVNGDGVQDLVFFSKNDPRAQLYFGVGDGTFADGGTFATGENAFDAQVADINGDGKVDLITTGTNSGNVSIMLGNGNGTFQAPRAFVAQAPRPGDNVGVNGLAIVDFGSPSDPFSGPDGHLDLVVTAATRSGVGQAEIILLPGLVDAAGNFAGFGAGQVLAHVGKAGKVAAVDFNNDGAPDVVATDNGGVRVVYGKPVALFPNDSPAHARNLGSVVHLETIPQAIVAGHDDAYIRYRVPVEAVPGAGNQVIDFSALFEHVQGAGLQMEVLDTAGHVLGSGERIRISAAQGTVLMIHVFGRTAEDGTRGSGVYTLDVDVLPQVIGLRAQSTLPGGPATNLVISLQGDRLDPDAAKDPANYTVTWLGPDGLAGTFDDRVVPLSAVAGALPVMYNPGANLDIASGLTYPTAVGQTITLIFDSPLPAGSYEVKLSPRIQSASFSAGEVGALAGDESFEGHPVVSARDGIIQNGASVVAANLVTPAGTPGDAGSIAQGTRFLTQLQSDLAALLDEILIKSGDDPAITDLLNNQILALFAPGTDAAGAFTIIWFDPVSIDLQSPQGGVSYSASSNAVASNLGQTFVSVGGTVEVIVMANVAGTFNLDVSNVPESARGGAVMLNGSSSQLLSFTDALRSGGGGGTFELTSLSSGGGGGSEGGGGGGSNVGPIAGGGGGTPGTPGGGGGGSGGPALSGGGASQAVLSTIATVLIAGPLTTGSSSSSTSSSGGPASAPAAGAAGGAPVVQPLSDRGGGRGRSYVGDRIRTETEEFDHSLVNDMEDFLTTTIERLRLSLFRFSELMRAMGWAGRTPASALMQGLLRALMRLGPQRAAAAPAAANPDRAQGDAANNAPEQPAAAAPAEPAAGDAANIDGVDDMLWDEGIAGLVDEPDFDDDLVAEGQTTDGRLHAAALVVTLGLYEAKSRVKGRSRPRSKKKVRIGSDE